MELTQEQLLRLLEALKERDIIVADSLEELLNLPKQKQNDDQHPNIPDFIEKYSEELLKLGKENKFEEYNKLLDTKLEEVKEDYKKLFNKMNVAYMKPYFEHTSMNEFSKAIQLNKSTDTRLDGIIKDSLKFDTCKTKEQHALREYIHQEQFKLFKLLFESCVGYPFPAALRTAEVCAMGKLPIVIENIYKYLDIDFNHKDTPDLAVIKLAIGTILETLEEIANMIVNVHNISDYIHKYADGSVTDNYLKYAIKNNKF